MSIARLRSKMNFPIVPSQVTWNVSQKPQLTESTFRSASSTRRASRTVSIIASVYL